VGDVELHLLQGLGEKDVGPTSTVDENLVESGACDYQLQDEWKPPWFREACLLICTGEGDGYLRPPERCWNHWFNVQDFPSSGLLSPSVGVNTKNWYMKETDLWAEFGKRAPFGKRFSSKHSVKMSAVGSTSSFGRRAISRLGEEAFGNTMTWLEHKEGTNS
jgi:hypothetical protein